MDHSYRKKLRSVRRRSLPFPNNHYPANGCDVEFKYKHNIVKLAISTSTPILSADLAAGHAEDF